MKPWPVVSVVLALCGGFALGWMVARGRDSAVRLPVATEAVRATAPVPPGSKPAPEMGSASPQVRRAGLAARAGSLARSDLASALRLLEGTPDPAERGAILEGIFGWLAGTVPPSEGLRQALALNEPDRRPALRALAAAWLGADVTGFDPQSLTRDGRGLVTAAAELLSTSQTAPPGAAKAWLEAFAEHPGRASIAGAYAAAHIAENPAEALALARDFTPWERREFLNTAIPGWAAKDPAAALAWFRAQAEPLPESLRTSILDAWAGANLDSARGQLATFTDPAERLEMARALGREMADQGTREAVAWAEGLADPTLRDAAHEAIYEATPRGVGALMGNEEGFPTIKGVLPDTAAEQAGLQPGDRLVEIAGPSGDFTPLYGTDLQHAISQVRGEPGQPARLRILRNDPDGRPVEHVLELTRQQLILPPAARHPD